MNKKKEVQLLKTATFVSGFGLLFFLAIAFTFPLRQSLLNLIYPKTVSEAAVSVSPFSPALKGGSNADDPAIWIHPTDPNKSVMFLSDKDSGIYVFDFNWSQCQHINFGTSLNNIDTRTGFNYGGQTIDIVAGNLRDAGKLAVLQVNPNHSCNNDVMTVLADNGSSGNDISGNSYGFTLYKRLSDGKMYVFDKPKSSSPIVQWELNGSSGSITTTQVRSFSGMGVSEGFVADDELGFVYFAEEGGGIHKYNADPDSGQNSELAFFAQGDGISGDREGLAIYKCNDGSGYLTLSSQGNSQFKVYERGGNNNFVKTFTANQANGTDGLDTNSASAPGLPNGFAVIHDDPNMQYFVYDWADIASGSPQLTVCPNGGPGGSPTTGPTPVPTATPGAGTPTAIPPTPTGPATQDGVGDINQDGTVDVFDLGIMAGNYGKTGIGAGSTEYEQRCDLKQDGTINVYDLGIFAGVYGNVYPTPTLPPGTTATATPVATATPGTGGVATDPNFKVAFIGDSGAGSNFQSVLNMIKAENTDMVLHQGDFAYSDGDQKWMDMIDATLGVTFPYFGSDGNHEDWQGDGYAAFFKARMAALGLNPPAGDLPDSYTITYKGLKVVFTKENGDPSFIDSELSNDNHIWKVCSWHRNMTTMQLGGKGNDQGWPDYENCTQHGAIIATAHEHTYHRTKTLTSPQNLTVDTTQHPPQTYNGIPNVYSNPNNLAVAPGKTFVFVSGIAGKSMRNQDRCTPTTYPYGGGSGCNYIWASVYTSDQNADYGALFITFNVNGDPRHATGYFKDINGNTIDQFEITAQ
jgi:myo-inositol-hexaphosphate 3-phosphohydrolase